MNLHPKHAEARKLAIERSMQQRLEPPRAEVSCSTYTGEVTDFYANPEHNGWGHLTVKTTDGEVKCNGTIEHLAPGLGLTVIVTGSWDMHRRYGWSFKLATTAVVEPTDASSFAAWLRGSAARGIGPALAQRIAETFTPDEFWKTLEDEPERFLEVKGVGGATLEVLQRLAGKRAEQLLMSRLLGLGLPEWLTRKALNKWGTSAATTIEANPYRLCELEGVAFRTADKVAAALGLDANNPDRVMAALDAAIQQTEQSRGDTWIDSMALVDAAYELLHISPAIIEAAICTAIKAARLFHADERIYRWPMWAAELAIVGAIPRLMPVTVALEQAQLDEQPEHLTPDQKRAVVRALVSQTAVITGGPGTGKTTIVRALLEALPAHRSVMLLAPTGKAAKRLAEATGRGAMTIHRGLGYNPETGWGYTASEWACPRTVIVDEFSMVDQLLAGHLFRATRGAQLVLVGDVHQLPPVGAGRVLRDIIDSGTVPVAELTEVHRSAADSWVARNAPRILRSEELDFTLTADFGFAPAPLSEHVGAGVLSAIAYCMQTGPRPQVLSPQRKGPAGVYHLNAVVQASLNPTPGGWVFQRDERHWELRVGDPVLQTTNDYDRDIFNGDVGVVRRITPKRLTADFDGISHEYTKSEARQLMLAYVTTVHKSQGSEYPWVVMVTHPAHRRMLSKQLLYTGVTRAKVGVILVGTQEAAALAASRSEHQRNSSLRDTLVKGLPE